MHDGEADGSKSLFHQLGGGLYQLLIRLAPGIHIDPHLIPGLAAQQLIAGHAQGLSLQIPERNVDTGHRRLGDGAAEMQVPGQGIPDPLNAHGVLAHQQLFHLF